MRRTIVQHTIYSRETDLLEHIRWCRDNLGARDINWDFSGGLSNLTVFVFDPDAAVFYCLKFPKAVAV